MNQRKCIGQSFRVLDINIEGISKSKSEFLSKLCIENAVDVILVQETHTVNAEELNKRGKVAGYQVVAAEFHSKYGIATYVRQGIKNIAALTSQKVVDIFQSAVKINGITFVNLYKPPNVAWPNTMIETFEHPSVYIGDFNSHASDWGYNNDDNNGEKLKMWASFNELKLIYDPKQRGTFHSARWDQDYNPDLCFVSCNDNGIPLGITRHVLNGFPNSQHRPIIFEIGLSIPVVQSVRRPRWNFNKARWSDYSKELDRVIGVIPPKPENYNRFVGLLVSIGKKHIPRGFRKEYIPCWQEDADRLYEEFKESGD